MGCGRVGALLARMLDAKGHEVTILDNDPNSFRRLEFSAELPDYKGKALAGNGINDNVLRRAGIQDANVFLAMTQGDNRNIMACQIAKHIYNVPRTICRIQDPLRRDIYMDLGLEIISPTSILTQILLEMLEDTPE